MGVGSESASKTDASRSKPLRGIEASHSMPNHPTSAALLKIRARESVGALLLGVAICGVLGFYVFALPANLTGPFEVGNFLCVVALRAAAVAFALLVWGALPGFVLIPLLEGIVEGLLGLALMAAAMLMLSDSPSPQTLLVFIFGCVSLSNGVGQLRGFVRIRRNGKPDPAVMDPNGHQATLAPPPALDSTQPHIAGMEETHRMEPLGDVQSVKGHSRRTGHGGSDAVEAELPGKVGAGSPPRQKPQTHEPPKAVPEMGFLAAFASPPSRAPQTTVGLEPSEHVAPATLQPDPSAPDAAFDSNSFDSGS